MKVLYIILSFLIGSQIYSQKTKTMYANESEVVGLFFPNAIGQAVVGAENFTFSYNKEIPQNVGLLQAVRGKKSNILVITGDGGIYSFVLEYRQNLDTLNYFVTLEERIDRDRPSVEVDSNKHLQSVNISPKIDLPKPKPDYRKEYFKKFSEYQLKHARGKLKRKRKGGLILKLNNLVYDQTEIYAVIEIKNRSGIDFETDYLRIFKVNGNNRKRASYQKVMMKPLLTHEFPSTIKNGKKIFFVMVLPKFTLGGAEKLMLQLKEFRGNRILNLSYKR